MKHRLLKPYVETFLAFGLNQPTEKPKRLTLRTVSLIDHILTNSKEKVRNYGVISSGMSDHDFIYCTRKTETVKTGKHNTISIRSYRKYSKESVLERLRKKDLPDYSTFNCIGVTYTNLTTALQDIVNEIAPMKDIRVKGNSKPWFDSNIMEAIRIRDKLKERLLGTKLHVDHERFKEQRNSLQQKIKNKKRNFVRNQLQKITEKPKELWKVLKNFDLRSKAAPISKMCLKENRFTQFDDKHKANNFKNFYSKLASDLVEKLPTAKNIFRENSVKKYHSAMNIPSNSFKFRNTKREL